MFFLLSALAAFSMETGTAKFTRRLLAVEKDIITAWPAFMAQTATTAQLYGPCPRFSANTVFISRGITKPNPKDSNKVRKCRILALHLAIASPLLIWFYLCICTIKAQLRRIRPGQKG
jgi:hypothetical protein